MNEKKIDHCGFWGGGRLENTGVEEKQIRRQCISQGGDNGALGQGWMSGMVRSGQILPKLWKCIGTSRSSGVTDDSRLLARAVGRMGLPIADRRKTSGELIWIGVGKIRSWVLNALSWGCLWDIVSVVGVGQDFSASALLTFWAG